MPDELLEKLSDTSSGGHGDKLKEILDPKVGGEAGRLRDKLAKLWESHRTSDKDESVERMMARNTALRLAKKQKPRKPDDPGVAKANVSQPITAPVTVPVATTPARHRSKPKHRAVRGKEREKGGPFYAD